MDDKKYFWLKLKRDFFKRHDIRIIESMPNGKDYILFYLKLLCESVDHDGNLRFSDSIPYSEDMLSTITNTNIDIVRSAIKVFTELNMMEILDDGTYFMNEVNKMIGCETEWAVRKREYRERKKIEENILIGQGQDNVRPLSDKSKSIDIDKDIDIYKENIINNNNTKEKNEIYQKIVNFWNEKGINKRNKINDDLKKAIDKALKEYSVEDIEKSIDHYKEVLDSNYFFNYKWSIVDFLNRKGGFKTFLDDGSNWVNYCEFKSKPKTVMQVNGLPAEELPDGYMFNDNNF